MRAKCAKVRSYLETLRERLRSRDATDAERDVLRPEGSVVSMSSRSRLRPRSTRSVRVAERELHVQRNTYVSVCILKSISLAMDMYVHGQRG